MNENSDPARQDKKEITLDYGSLLEKRYPDDLLENAASSLTSKYRGKVTCNAGMYNHRSRTQRTFQDERSKYTQIRYLAFFKEIESGYIETALSDFIKSAGFPVAIYSLSESMLSAVERVISLNNRKLIRTSSGEGKVRRKGFLGLLEAVWSKLEEINSL
jgi:hypothetical protein